MRDGREEFGNGKNISNNFRCMIVDEAVNSRAKCRLADFESKEDEMRS